MPDAVARFGEIHDAASAPPATSAISKTASAAGLEALDGTADFREDVWQREGGGGGRTRVLADGGVFEKAGVNFSEVFGQMSEEFAKQVPGEGRDFTATGISLVLHPRNPMVPTVHANFRFLTKGDRQWFGGGADLTPYYPYREDVIHFHRILEAVCDAARPVDRLRPAQELVRRLFLLAAPAANLAASAASSSITWRRSGSALRVSSRTAATPSSMRICPSSRGARTSRTRSEQRAFQEFRRGRYVEFNLIYDRGTLVRPEDRRPHRVDPDVAAAAGEMGL